MTHPNHRIKEAICAFHFKRLSNEFSFEQWSGDIKTKFESINLMFRHEVRPVSISIEFSSEKNDETPTVTQTKEIGDEQLVFQAPDVDRFVVISKEFISFHYVKTYVGWDIFLKELIKPCLAIFLEYSKEVRLIKSQMTYVNHFETNFNNFTVGDWFKYAMSPTDFENAFDWVQNHQTVFKTRDNTAELTLITRYIIPQEESPFLYLLAGAKVNAIENVNSLANYEIIAQKAHDFASKLFLNAVTQKTIDFISQVKV